MQRRHLDHGTGAEFYDFIAENYAGGAVYFSTDKFSEYAVMYKDTRVPHHHGDNWSPKTGDTADMTLYVSLMLLSVMGMGVTVVTGKRKEKSSEKC